MSSFMIRGLVCLFGLAGLLLSVSPASAEEGRWEIGILFDSAIEEFDDSNSDFPFDFDNTQGVGLKLGYVLTQNLTLEGAFERYGEFDLDDTAGAGASLTFANGEASEIWMVTASLKFYPLARRSTSNFRPYLLGGVGYMEGELDIILTGGFPAAIERDRNALVWQLGAGLDYSMGERWVLGLETQYKLPRKSLRSVEFWTFGANLRYLF